MFATLRGPLFAIGDEELLEWHALGHGFRPHRRADGRCRRRSRPWARRSTTLRRPASPAQRTGRWPRPSAGCSRPRARTSASCCGRRRAGAGQRAAHRRAGAALRGRRRALVPRLRRRAARRGRPRAGARGADPRGGQRRRAPDDRAQGQGPRVPGRHPGRHRLQAQSRRRAAATSTPRADWARSSWPAGRRSTCATTTRSKPRATRPRACGSPTSPPRAPATCWSCRRSATGPQDKHWVQPLSAALYGGDAVDAPGVPAFTGKDTHLDRPPSNMPTLHTMRPGAYAHTDPTTRRALHRGVVGSAAARPARRRTARPASRAPDRARTRRPRSWRPTAPTTTRWRALARGHAARRAPRPACRTMTATEWADASLDGARRRAARDGRRARRASSWSWTWPWPTAAAVGPALRHARARAARARGRSTPVHRRRSRGWRRCRRACSARPTTNAPPRRSSPTRCCAHPLVRPRARGRVAAGRACRREVPLAVAVRRRARGRPGRPALGRRRSLDGRGLQDRRRSRRQRAGLRACRWRCISKRSRRATGRPAEGAAAARLAGRRLPLSIVADMSTSRPHPFPRPLRPHRLRPRPRLHGHVRLLRRGRRRPRRLRPSTARIDLGVTFLDTADIYGPFTNETLVGKAIRDRRDAGGPRHQVRHRCASADGTPVGINGRPEYVRQACDASLGAAGRRRDRPLLPAPRRSAGADRRHRRRDGRARARRQGALPRAVGSGAGDAAARAWRCIRSPRCRPNIRCGAAIRKGDLLATCRELGIGFVAYSPLGRGFLTGRFRTIEDLDPTDWRRNNPRFQGENFQKNLDVVAEVQAIARAKGCTPAQLALAWLLAQGDDIVPIPGSTRAERVEENAGAAAVTLTARRAGVARRAGARRSPASATWKAA